ncbi:MAG: hypothetical protein J7K73_00025 [Nanoarchaeota archaeon]|nr:hypothetical protein [Nanoarchaeota archaeon]
MVVEVIIFVISVAAVISAIDFISKAVANLASTTGVPRYLVSTVILSFIISLPVFLTMLFSNIFNVPTLGVSALIGFSIAVLTLIMGIFLIKNEVSVEYERYRNATFMWAASVLFFVVTLDQLIDRADALFLLVVFAFYCLYVYYRTKKAKEYTFLKARQSNKILFIPAIIAIILSTFAAVATISIMSYNFLIPAAFISLTVYGLLLSLPLLDLINNVFKSPILTFDNLLGSIVFSLTFVPGVVALINPIPYNLSYNYGFLPLLFLSILSLSFAISTRLRKSIHTKTGIALLVSYIMYILLVLFG